MSAITYRPAVLDDLDVLRRWDQAPQVKAAAGDPDANYWDWPEMLSHPAPWREFLIAEAAGRPIGMMQIIDPAKETTHYWGDCGPNLRAIDIWIGEEDALGKGYGTAMMQAAIERCFSDPAVTAILIDPLATNTDAHRFYERLGFQFVERRTFLGVDECFVYRLERPS